MSAKTEDVSPEPCPFCGGDGVSVTDATRILGVWNLIHRCPVVGAISLQGDSREKVVATWNTRALLASHGAQAERIASLEAGVRLIRATAQGDGHAHLIVKACDSLISGKASA